MHAQPLRRSLNHPASLWLAFALVQCWIVYQAYQHGPQIFGDVDLYRWWMLGGLEGWLGWPVLDYSWVYPIGALVPMLLPALVTSTVEHYQVAWMALVLLCHIAAFACLIHPRLLSRKPSASAPSFNQEPRRAGAWWWLAFLAALGPIWIGRLEGVLAAIILLALIAIPSRPGAAAILATAGAWIKIAPGAIVIALVCGARGLAGRAKQSSTWRWAARHVVIPAGCVSLVLVAVALLGGAGGRALSVFGQQSGRGLQVESVAATWFSLARLWNPDISFAFNPDIITWEVVYPAATAVAAVLDVVMLLAVLAVGYLTFRASRRLPLGSPQQLEVIYLSVTAIMAALIVFNKVGSPQFQAWLGSCIAAGMACAPAQGTLSRPTPGQPGLSQTTPGQTNRRWFLPAIITLLAAGLTYLLYPVFYGPFLSGQAPMIAVAAVRNVLLVVLLAWATWSLARIAMPRGGASRHQGLSQPSLSSGPVCPDPM